jgi:hypothetical protein
MFTKLYLAIALGVLGFSVVMVSGEAFAGGCDSVNNPCQGSCNSKYLYNPQLKACATSDPNADPACKTEVQGCYDCECKKSGSTNNCKCQD